MAHSFRQPYFRRRMPDRLQRLQRTLPPSTSVVSQLVYVHTDAQYLHQPLAQAPISSVLLWRCQEQYWLCLWWNVIVVSLSGRVRKRRVKRQDARRWRKVLLMVGTCQRMQGGGLKWAWLGRLARGRWRKWKWRETWQNLAPLKTLTPRLWAKVFDSSPCDCSNVPCGMSTHVADGYLSIFIFQNEQKQGKKDWRKR